MRAFQTSACIALVAWFLPLQQTDAAPLPPPMPAVTAAAADTTLERLFIAGVNFGATTTPSVELGGVLLRVESWSSADIVAWLPPDIGAGTYALRVVRGGLHPAPL